MLVAICLFALLVSASIHYFSQVSTSLVTAQTTAATWSKIYGSGGAYDAIQTSDGGIAVVGSCETSAGSYWLIKLDAEGNVQWNESSTSYFNAFPKSVVETSDGGYAVVGTCGFAEGSDYYGLLLVKTDKYGNIQWKKTYGDANGVSEGNYLIQTNDGGYAIVGDYGRSNAPGGWDFLFIKTDSAGNLQWSKVIAGPDGQDDDRAECIVQTSDGGYALTGSTSIPGNTPLFWLVKTDSAGNVQWNKTYTESIWNWPYSVVQTTDGGYALAGIASSQIGGNGSFWLVKTDPSGNMEWNKNFGSNAWWVNSVIQTSDGGYALAGGNSDFQVVKTDAQGNLQWTYDEEAENGRVVGNVIIQTRDGSYVVVGQQNSNKCAYFWVAKIGSNGEPPASTPEPSVTPPPAGQQNATMIDLSCQSSTAYSALKVTITGSLIFNGAGLAGVPILLSYSDNNGASWKDLTTVYTDDSGYFVVLWTPLVTGSYLIKAVWNGAPNAPETSTIVSFTISPSDSQSVFSVASNSTLTAFSFDSEEKTVSFQVTGPPDTSGYVDLYIPKSLISDASGLKVYIDGETLSYTSQSQGDAWLVSFTYHHSTHQITVNLNASATELLPEQWLYITLVSAAVITTIALLAFERKKKGKNSKDIHRKTLPPKVLISQVTNAFLSLLKEDI
jgi:hypothetical protein